MSDSVNQKGASDANSDKLNTILAELQFFSKQFLKSPSDEVGETISKSIIKFLELSDDVEKIEKFLKILDDYVPSAKKETFFVNLIKIRRTLRNLINDGTLSEDMLLENGEIRQSYHERVLEINPNKNNRYLLVLSLIDLVLDCRLSDRDFEADMITQKLSRAKEVFSQISETADSIYYGIGSSLYNAEFKFLVDQQAPLNVTAACLNTLTHITLKEYKYTEDIDVFNNLLCYYNSYMLLDLFPEEEEKENVKEVYNILKKLGDDDAINSKYKRFFLNFHKIYYL